MEAAVGRKAAVGLLKAMLLARKLEIVGIIVMKEKQWLLRGPEMYERFTENAVESVMLARAEAQRLGYNRCGTEHILLAISKHADGPVRSILTNAGAGDQEILREIIAISREAVCEDDEQITSNCKVLYQIAINESLKQNHNYVSVWHLLVSMLSMEQSTAVKILRNLSVSITELNAELFRETTMRADKAAVLSQKVKSAASTAAKLAEDGETERAESMLNQKRDYEKALRDLTRPL